MTSNKTTESLQGAVRKWEAILQGGLDKAAENCPLCTAFHGCDNCPVAIVARAKECKNTPYEDWVEHHKAKHHRFGSVLGHRPILRCLCPTCKQIARAEIKFLKEVIKNNQERRY